MSRGIILTYYQIKSNQIKSLLLSHHHSTSALVSEILMSVLQTVQKNNRQFTYGQTVQKKKKKTTDNLHMDRQCKKLHWSIYSAPDSAKKQQQFTYGQYIFTDCTEDNVQNTHTYTQYTVYYKDILNYQRHIIHRMGTSALCTVSIHNVVYA